MSTEPLSQQIEVAVVLFAMLIAIYLLPSNAEIAAHFHAWKKTRAERKGARRMRIH